MPFVEQTNEIYDTIFNANVRGVFWSMKHEAKAMLAQGGGTIINNASMGGVIGFANAGLYIASKHAVLGLKAKWICAVARWLRRSLPRPEAVSYSITGGITADRADDLEQPIQGISSDCGRRRQTYSDNEMTMLFERRRNKGGVNCLHAHHPVKCRSPVSPEVEP